MARKRLVRNTLNPLVSGDYQSLTKYINILPLLEIPPPSLYHRGLRLLKVRPKPVQATSKEHLRELIKEQIQIYGSKCDLHHIDISKVNDMSGLFSCLSFHGDISRWDVSHVEQMQEMFSQSSFHGDISAWDVSKVYNMRAMFRGSHFNGDISKWNTGNVMRMGSMFEHSAFEGDISGWNVSNVQDMSNLFKDTYYQGDLSSWSISPECKIDHAAPKKYGNCPLFLACAIEDQVTRISRLEPHYSEAYAIVESLGMKGLQAGYAMYQMMRGQPYSSITPACELNDFS